MRTPKKNSLWKDLIFNVIIPTLILINAGRIEKFSDIFLINTPWKVFVIALSFPFLYGIHDLIKSKRWNIFSVVGFIGVVLTGGIGLLKLPREYMIAKEGLVPFIIFLVILLSLRWNRAIVNFFILNDSLFNVEKIRLALKEKNTEKEFDKVMRSATILIAFTFLFSAIAHFVLAMNIFKSETGTTEFSEEVGYMKIVSYFVIVIPTTALMGIAMFKVFKGVKKLTGYSIEDVMAENLVDKGIYMTLQEKFAKYGQENVFRFFSELNETQKDALIKQAESIDLQELENLAKSLESHEAKQDFSKLKPANFSPLPENKSQDELWKKAKSIGEDAIRNGKVAAFVVAGGQGTRLGFDAPKGLYKVSPVNHKSLFQIFAEKILYASKKYNVDIPWLVMTSHINNTATQKFFYDNNFFGMNKENVIFFEQGLMPAIGFDGKILLEAKDKIVMTPDGHGGSLRAMVKSGALSELKRRGVECISYYQVDNPLVDIIDPYFVGFHLMNKSEMSSKMIPKAYPLEKVGHFCINEKGNFCVIEYSDLPTSMQEERDEKGNLRFSAGSIAIHIFDINFIDRLGDSNSKIKMPFHKAEKKIPYIDKDGKLIKPEKPNGIKFEMFVFDALEMAKNPIIIECSRADEFSPVKNAEGVDSPQTCKNHQKAQFARWIREAGGDISCNDDGVPNFDIEISPLYASNAEDFIAKWKVESISENKYIS